MKQYIDKDDIVAEIERKKAYAQTLGDNAINSSMQQFYDGMREGCDNLLSFLNTLEVKENDLVEELDYDDYMAFFKEHPEYSNGDWGFEETWAFGQYCYTLGLKAQKGSE